MESRGGEERRKGKEQGGVRRGEEKFGKERLEEREG